MPTPDCSTNFDALKLVREGTTQAQRMPDALAPERAPADAKTIAHDLVFARGYAARLRYIDETNTDTGKDWVPFFENDVSAQLATVAIEDIERYKATIKAWFDTLNDSAHTSDPGLLKDTLGFLFGGVGTLAAQIDAFKERLPVDEPSKAALQDLVTQQLAPAFRRLMAYHQAGKARSLVGSAPAPGDVQILRARIASFDAVLAAGLSSDWGAGGPVDEDASVYGDPALDVFGRINHCSTHTLFRSAFDEFLRGFARVIALASAALQRTLEGWDGHEPHYALFLAFLRLFAQARQASNTLTKRHLDFYYKQVLRLGEKGPQPGHAHLLVELAKHVRSHAIAEGVPFKAGKDKKGRDAFFANDEELVANQGKVAALKTVYRHGPEPVAASGMDEGRIFASPVADSDDGRGAPLTTPDQSWHPFHNKVYEEGALTEIRMPPANVGFAIASHHLLLAGGQRRVEARFSITGSLGYDGLEDDIRCLVTTEKGWLEKAAVGFARDPDAPGTLLLVIELSGADPPVRPYVAQVHGHTFATNLPLLLVTLKQDRDRAYAYGRLRDLVVSAVDLQVSVRGLQALAVSNDFGPVDISKPFQPFGPSPVAGNSLLIGSREVFQKTLTAAAINIAWLTAPKPYKSVGTPGVEVECLGDGRWKPASTDPMPVTASVFSLGSEADAAVLDTPDFSADEHYGVQAGRGYVKLSLGGDFGQTGHLEDLLRYLRKENDVINPGPPPVGPTAAALSLDYDAATKLELDSAAPASFEKRTGRFFHLAPFGDAEAHPCLNAARKVYLLPQFSFVRDAAVVASEAEFCIGIGGLEPPQNLSLLFQVVDGTSNPLTVKPPRHVAWSYLRNNEWVAFPDNDVRDATGALLDSGIVTFAVPRDATPDNTLLPAGMWWIRAAVADKSDAVCRLQRVGAQALRATFVDRGNAPDFSAQPLPPGTIGKLDPPDSAVKAIQQPFASFGGRGAEEPAAFYQRISERLRHKDRSITLWDCERLVLEAFPQIHKVRCLNHTRFEPGESGAGIYRELAPGHVTIVTIPRLDVLNLRDPLKPYTSLGVLEQIKAFIAARASCFARLHVRNPRFEGVRVRCNVRLRDGYDEGHSIRQTAEAITRFLSPWAYAGGGTPSFGGKVYKSVLVNFVEDLQWVDYVTDFQVFRDLDGEPPGSTDFDEVQGSTAVSVLVSVPPSRHQIAPIHAVEPAQGESCACQA
jgi:hypothetical protein